MKRGLIIISAIFLFVFLSSFILAQEVVEDVNIEGQESETDQAIANLPEAGILPTSIFYGFKTAFQNLRLALLRNEAKERYRLRLLDLRLAEMKRLQELSEELNATGKPTEKIGAKIERLTERYENQLEVGEERIKKLKALGRNVTALQEHVANSTYKHILVLKRVSGKVPIKARIAILRTINRSLTGYEKAISSVLEGKGLEKEAVKDLLAEARERYKERIQNRTESKICIQVLTQAYNPETEECKIFASPCDVPEGWIRKPCKVEALKEDIVAIKQNITAFRQKITAVRRAAVIASKIVRSKAAVTATTEAAVSVGE